MKKKSLILTLASLLLLVFTSCTSDESKVTVFFGGSTEYSVVISADASDDEKNLASEMQNLSGAKEILTDMSVESAREIIIGDTSRAATAAMAEKLREAQSAYAIHYLIAESDGKIVIFSNADVGYVYAMEYLKEKYITDGAFVIPKGTCDINYTLWDDYLNSELYYNRLLAESEKNPINGGTESGTGDITMEYWIEKYKNMVADFDTASFGTYASTEFSSKNKYTVKPAEYPTVGAHPRVLFTENSINTLRENLNAKENSNARTKYIALSEAGCDGKFRPRSSNETTNWDATIAGKIEAMAYRYAMTGDQIYGYQALYAIKNAILTIDVTHDEPDWCREYGYLMYVCACVYDWCYDLMTETDKTQLINGTVNLLGMHLEIVCYVNETNKVPSAQQAAYGHGAEDQLLVDYLSFAIACYDEAPEIYDFVAGRIYTEYVDAQNFLYDSGSPYEGTMYGAHRGNATMMANILFDRMTDGTEAPFTDSLEDVAITMIHQIRPDGWVYRIGDINENKTDYDYRAHGAFWFYTGNFYENSYIKSYAYEYLNRFSSFTNAVALLSSIQLLAINDPEVSYVYHGTAPLTTSTTYPYTSIYAKSENENPNAFGVYMTMPETHVYSHGHAEAGSFQIYYNGSILASDSGAYTSWGGLHHMSYNMSTISSNSILVYNPKYAGTTNSQQGNLVYSGGQSIASSVKLPYTLSDIKTNPRFNQCTSLGSVTVEQNGLYLYSYLGGDMTKAYDATTVSDVSRYMFTVATGDKNCPYAVLIFDRITSKDEDFHKAALIHVQNEPTITKDGYAIITNGDGRLVVQSVGEACEYVKWGGKDKEFWIPGVDENGNYSLADGYNIPTNIALKDGSEAEYGWGRIEISPAEAAKTNYMLTVMYVTDSSNNTITKAEKITSDNLAGSVIFGKAVLFSKNEKLLTKESSFELSAGADCFVSGVKEGTWQITHANGETETVTVKGGENLITFKANEAGTYTLKPVN